MAKKRKTQRRGGPPAGGKGTVLTLVLMLVVTALAVALFLHLREQQAAAVPVVDLPDAPPIPVEEGVTLDTLPAFSGEPFVVLGDNVPEFPQEDLDAEPFESYSPLDGLGRCGVCYACVAPETMPTEDRGDIGSVKPTGWVQARYDFVDGESLYNRCHLIGFQLTGENANKENLITGTRYMNVDGMLPFENQVAEYVEDTGGRVLYRVTPVFQGDDLVAAGVRMEALSLEDQGERVCFDVYVYNCQPGVVINYADGVSRLDTAEPPSGGGTTLYILNMNSRVFHKPGCPGALSMREENRREHTGDRETLLQWGYRPCNQCSP